jgi:hypothetical protein
MASRGEVQFSILLVVCVPYGLKVKGALHQHPILISISFDVKGYKFNFNFNFSF